MLTDVSVWAGETLYSAHRLVLALSSQYFRLVVTGSAAGEGKHPVIFLKVDIATGGVYMVDFFCRSSVTWQLY